MAKLTRESRLREKRAEKAARKAARKLEAENPQQPYEDGLRDEDGFLRPEPTHEGVLPDEPTGSPDSAVDSPLAAVAETASDA